MEYISKMPPKQRKRAILSKGSSSWTSSPGAGWVWGRQPHSWRNIWSHPLLPKLVGRAKLEVRKAPAASPAPDIPSRDSLLHHLRVFYPFSQPMSQSFPLELSKEYSAPLQTHVELPSQ